MAKNRRKQKRNGRSAVSAAVVESVSIDLPLRTNWKPCWVWMLESGSIDEAEAEACIRYADDYNMCGYDRGAGALDYSKTRVDGGSGGEMSDRRAAAMHRFGKVQNALPDKLRNVCMSCLGDGSSITRHAAVSGIKYDTISRRLKKAIEILSGPHGYHTKRPPVRHTIRTAFDCDVEMREAA